MSANVDRARRVAGLFNETIGRGNTEVSAEARNLWAEEPLIVPLRAALESTEYSGPTALEDFAADTVESWSRLQFEEEKAVDVDENRVMLVGRLSGTGHDTGAETEMDVAVLLEFEEGRLAVFRTFLSEDEAMRAVSR